MAVYHQYCGKVDPAPERKHSFSLFRCYTHVVGLLAIRYYFKIVVQNVSFRKITALKISASESAGQ